MNRSWARYSKNGSYRAVAGGILALLNVIPAGILFGTAAAPHCVAFPQKPASKCLSEQYWY